MDAEAAKVERAAEIIGMRTVRDVRPGDWNRWCESVKEDYRVIAREALRAARNT